MAKHSLSVVRQDYIAYSRDRNITCTAKKERKKNVASRISAKKVSRATPTQQPQPIPSTSSFLLSPFSITQRALLNQEDAPVFIILSKSARFSSVLLYNLSPPVYPRDGPTFRGEHLRVSLTSHLSYDLNTRIISIFGTESTDSNHRGYPVLLTQLAHARCHSVVYRLRACDLSIRGCYCV